MPTPRTLLRIPLTKIREIYQTLKDAFVVTSYEGNPRTPLLIAFPYSKELEAKFVQEKDLFEKLNASKAVSKNGTDVVKEEITYDEYRRRLLEIGMQQLQEGIILVKPGHVIAAESLEETKKKNRLLATELLLEAAKLWAGHKDWHICPHCGHMMLPKTVHVEREALKTVETTEGKELSNGEALPANA